ncbi:hypothetical protein ALP75_204559 [Pseudomonas syringae pv. actinidiae]|nr:hypothetical protein ALP75_204559 [Pseudomonas syringae pv. actinidiae]
MGFMQAEHGLAVVTQMKGDIETRQRHTLDHFVQVIEFGFLGLEKLPPCGRIEEQVAHFHRRAHRMRSRLHARIHVAPFGLDLPGLIGVAGARGQCQARHRADRRQRLTAKTQAHDPLKVFQVTNLAGRVSRQSQRQVVGGNSAAVIAHFQQLDAGLLDIDINASSARIEAVFQQLLDHRRRTLDHLARGDLVGQTRAEQFNARSVQDSLRVIGFAAVKEKISHYWVATSALGIRRSWPIFNSSVFRLLALRSVAMFMS